MPKLIKLMPCEWFTFDPECDIPNWLTMVIELTIGGIVASIIFGWQWNIRAHRRDTGQAKIILHLTLLKEALQKHETAINNYFDKKISVEELAKDKENRFYHLEQLKLAITLFQDSMNPSISTGIDEIIDYSKWNTLDDRKIELEHNSFIISKIDTLLNKYLKRRSKLVKKIFEERKKEFEKAKLRK